MASLILYPFFRILRKLDTLTNRLYIKCKLLYYVELSHRKYRIHNSLKAGKGLSIISDLSNTSLILENNIVFRDNLHIVLGNSGKLLIQNNCFFNNRCSVNCFGNIEIGNNNQFGENVLFYDHNHKYKDQNTLISKQGYALGFIKIGNNCWVGSNVVILMNVEIGDNVVIGAGAVIYKSIPSNTIVINQQQLLLRPINQLP